jgi:outer membrane protein assembly factor BamA
MLALLLVAVGIGEAPAQIKEPARVGQIFILGNKVTPQGFILDRLELYPGQVLTDADLCAARRRLLRLTVLGIGSSVSVSDDPTASAYKDVCVQVNEAPIAYLLIGVPNALLDRLYRR